MRELMTQDMIKNILPQKYRFEGLMQSWGWKGNKRAKGTPRADHKPLTYEDFVSTLDFSDLSDEEFLEKYTVFMFYRAKMM